jgi:TolB-like protein
MGFFRELKRRNVIRVGVAYLVTVWLLLQVSDVVIGNIGAPDWVFKAIMLILAIGFPMALIFAWVFELTPEGIKKEKEVDRARSIAPQTGRKLDFTIIGLLALGLAYFIWESRFAAAPGAAGAATPAGSGAAVRVAAPAAEPAANVARDQKSIAVLPFTTRSTLEDDRFFSDGMHDDLLTQLSKVGDLRVISRTSVMEYRDTTKNMREIAAELGVASVLEGAVQRAGRQVRINVQLIDAATDQHLWAEIYDRELTTDNLFAIQSEIASAIAGALHATLSPAEKQQIEQRRLTGNLEALKAYQKARLLGENRDLDNLTRAETEARLALQLDPGFAAAWAQLAYIQMALYWHVEIRPEWRAAARESIDQGRAIAPDLPELHIAEGYYHYWGFRDYAQALRSLAPVLEIYPNNAELLKVQAYINRRSGAFAASLEGLLKALELEPRSAEIISTLSETYLGLRDFRKAVDYLALLEAIDPNHQVYHYTAGNNRYAIDGDAAAALRHWRTDPAEFIFETWRTLTAMDDFESFVDFDAFAEAQGIGEINYSPDMMRGLTRRLAGDRAAAMPDLDRARKHYVGLLDRQANDFRALKPLCLVEGARNDAAAAASACQQALDHLPADQYDRNYHRAELAGGLALAGLKEQALDLVESILSEPFGPSPTELQLDAILRDLHGEPRWQALMDE